MRMLGKGDAPLTSLSVKNGHASHSPALPELPGIFVFLFWSALLHLTLLLVLNELIDGSRPAKYTILQVRLAPVVAPGKPSPTPDLYAGAIRDMESGMKAWTNITPANDPGQAKPFQNRRSAESAALSIDADYYYKSSELDEQPTPLKPVVPVYPDLAKARGVEGYAKLLLLIDEQGEVRHIDVLESNPPDVFGDAAMDAFRSMMFKPGQRASFPVKSRMVIKIEFKMEPELK